MMFLTLLAAGAVWWSHELRRRSWLRRGWHDCRRIYALTPRRRMLCQGWRDCRAIADLNYWKRWRN